MQIKNNAMGSMREVRAKKTANTFIENKKAASNAICRPYIPRAMPYMRNIDNMPNIAPGRRATYRPTPNNLKKMCWITNTTGG